MNDEEVLCAFKVPIGDESRIAVWALDYWSTESGQRREPTPLRIVVPPYSGNPNITAQQGAFSLWLSPDGQLDVDRRSLEDQMLESDHWSEEDEFPTFRLITLPLIFAPFACSILAERSYSAARLFPGFGGAAEAVSERAIVETEIKRMKRLALSL